MIVHPVTDTELAACQAFLLAHSGVSPSADSRYVCWIEEDKLRVLVCFNGFVGRICQMHVAMAPDYHYTPRAMLVACFRYVFKDCKCAMVLGVVNSLNTRAMRYDLHLGFTEVFRLPKMHDNGGAIVLMGMTEDECAWLNQPAEVITHTKVTDDHIAL